MGLPIEDTVVTFPAGGLTGVSEVRCAAATPAGVFVVTAATPFHPVDPGWPDQGPDCGTATIGGVQYPVTDVVLGAGDGSTVYFGDEVPVRRGTPGWAFLVGHRLPAGTPVPEVGASVSWTVDAAHRQALSAGHTGCHLAALALNAALADRWRKAVSADGLGSPDFDGRALVSSRILPNGSVDTYRLGKSLRKSGFDSDGLAVELPEVAAEANRRLGQWAAAAAPVRVEVAGPLLTDLREWVCDLPDGSVRIPCGGTHVTSLAAFDDVRIALELDESGQTLVMRTSVVPAGDRS